MPDQITPAQALASAIRTVRAGERPDLLGLSRRNQSEAAENARRVANSERRAQAYLAALAGSFELLPVRPADHGWMTAPEGQLAHFCTECDRAQFELDRAMRVLHHEFCVEGEWTDCPRCSTLINPGTASADRGAPSVFPISVPHTLKEQILIDGTWHHLAYVFAGDLPRLYVDGKPARVRGEIAWFERVLSEAEIAASDVIAFASPEPDPTTTTENPE